MAIPIGDPREKAYRDKELANDIGMLRSGRIFRDIERAARFESCDWEQPIREGNFIAVTLPEIQQIAHVRAAVVGQGASGDRRRQI